MKVHRRKKQGWVSQKEYKDIAPVYWDGVKRVRAQLPLKSVADVKGNKMNYCNRGCGKD